MTSAIARTHIPGDWYPVGLPENIVLGSDVYIDSSYGFAGFDSLENPALTVGEASGIYDRAALIVGPRGRVTIGAFTVLNGTYVVCNERVNIGAHCLLSWGVVITDNWLPRRFTRLQRRETLARVGESTVRHQPETAAPKPVVIEDNVWIGFDAVILPGVRVGRGAIIGARSIVREDVPPYSVIAGDPPRILRTIDADDTEDARAEALATLVRNR